MSSTDEWDTLDEAMADKLVLTDVAFISDKKKPPPDYEVVSWSSFISILVNIFCLVRLRTRTMERRLTFPRAVLGSLPPRDMSAILERKIPSGYSYIRKKFIREALF